jgi:hypothetical protein
MGKLFKNNSRRDGCCLAVDMDSRLSGKELCGNVGARGGGFACAPEVPLGCGVHNCLASEWRLWFQTGWGPLGGNGNGHPDAQHIQKPCKNQKNQKNQKPMFTKPCKNQKNQKNQKKMQTTAKAKPGTS